MLSLQLKKMGLGTEMTHLKIEKSFYRIDWKVNFNGQQFSGVKPKELVTDAELSAKNCTPMFFKKKIVPPDQRN